MGGGFDAATNRRRASARRPQADVDSGRDVVDVADRLPHFGQRLLELFVSRVQQLLYRSERSAQPDQKVAQGPGHHEAEYPNPQPHAARTVLPVKPLPPHITTPLPS